MYNFVHLYFLFFVHSYIIINIESIIFSTFVLFSLSTLYIYILWSKLYDIVCHIVYDFLFSSLSPALWLTIIPQDNQFVCQILFGELQIAGSGTITESLNGTYSVQTGKEELMQIRAENLTRSKGTLYFEPSAFVLQQLAAEMQIADAADMADIVLCICFEENNTDSQCEFLVFSSDVSLMELHISGKATEYPNILLPENVTDAANEENIYNWLSGLDWEHLLENLSDAGVPEGLLEGLLSAAGAE